jgi:acetolactate synthase-1/3 small subunit
MKRTLSVFVENNPGVLSKVSGLFGRRGYNIESLVVSETEDRTISRMTIIVDGDDEILEQVKKQLNKLVDVIKVSDLTNEETVDRQLLLIRVNADNSTRTEIIQLMDIFRARIVDIGRKSLMIEATGDETKIDAIIKSLQPFGIQELVKTGTISVVRGSKEK